MNRFFKLWKPYYIDSYTEQNLSVSDVPFNSEKFYIKMYCEREKTETLVQQDQPIPAEEHATPPGEFQDQGDNVRKYYY
jgi:hypothetical protein